MGLITAYVLPIAPGQSDRVENFGKEIEPVIDEFERLNDQATVTRYVTFVQPSPMGDLAIVVMEAEEPARINRGFTDSAYDSWWLGFLKEVHGIDLMAMPEPPPLPRLVYAWEKRSE